MENLCRKMKFNDVKNAFQLIYSNDVRNSKNILKIFILLLEMRSFKNGLFGSYCQFTTFDNDHFRCWQFYNQKKECHCVFGPLIGCVFDNFNTKCLIKKMSCNYKNLFTDKNNVLVSFIPLSSIIIICKCSNYIIAISK